MKEGKKMNEILRKIELGNLDQVTTLIQDRLSDKSKTVVVTLNSEHLVTLDPQLENMYLDPSTVIVADGISAQLATRLKVKQKVIKIPGVSLVENLLLYANSNNLAVGVFGSTRLSLNLFEQRSKEVYPNISKLICIDGYSNEPLKTLQSYADMDLDLILVAMGVPRQEKMISETFHHFNKGVIIGVGGSIDVIGGSKRRAPNIFIKTNTEWLYRIAREPKRISRFIRSNFKFLRYVIFDKK